jgi:putative heme transporter
VLVVGDGSGDDDLDPSSGGGRGPDGPGRPPTVVAWFDVTAQYAWRGLAILVAGAAVLWTLAFLYLVTMPVIVALVLSTFCAPLARRLERRGLAPGLAAAVVVLGGLALLGAVVAVSAPAFARQAQELGPTIEEGVDDFFEWLEEGPVGYDRAEVDAAIADYLEDDGVLADLAGRLAVRVAEVAAGLVLTLVLLFFFIKDGRQIVRWFVDRVPDRQRDAVCAVGARSWRALGGFMGGTAQVAAIDAVGIGVGLAVIGVPLVLPLAFLVFLGGFVPVVGAAVTGLLAVLVALAWGGVGPALLVLALVVVVQQVESNLLQPIIMRRAVALHPVVVLGGITAGAVIGGIIGAFLAVPVTAMAAAAGNELRLRHEARLAGITLGPSPIGGAWANGDGGGPDGGAGGAAGGGGGDEHVTELADVPRLPAGDDRDPDDRPGGGRADPETSGPSTP